METVFDCIIIGAGVSGMTAALYLKRYGYNILLLEKGVPGGQINQSYIIENYPGFDKIDGPSLALNILNQMKKINLSPTYGTVKKVYQEQKVNKVVTDVNIYTGKTIILATGRQPKKLGIANEENLIGHGISYCATCDGPLFKGKDVCIVGGGNSALEESLYLSSICRKVSILYRGDKLSADKVIVEKVKNIKNIDIKYNSVVNTFNENDGYLTGITLQDGTMIPCEGVFIYIGLYSDLDYLSDLQLERKETQLIVAEDMSTNIKSIYACGDITQKTLYQIVTAASDGAIVAHSVKQYLQNEE